MPKASASRARRRQSRHHRQLARPDANGLGRSRRFFQTYFSTYPGHYFTGDGCRRDEDGYYWITGRVDDVINVSGSPDGHGRGRKRAGRPRQGAEAAVVGMPHDIKGRASTPTCS
jgi:acyl-coenzyme A synthetase/AMP-(fatty) acid ligase